MKLTVQKMMPSMAMMLMALADHPNVEVVNTGKPKLSEDEKKRLQGLKEYIFGETSIWAINEKNAIRKAKKLGL